VTCHQEAADAAALGSGRFDAIQKRVSDFQSKHLKESQEVSYQFEWMREHTHLKMEERVATASMLKSIENFKSSLEDGYSFGTQPSPGMNEAKDDQNALLRDIAQVVHSIKETPSIIERESAELKDTLVALRQAVATFSADRCVTNENNGCTTDNDGDGNEQQGKVCLLAEILLQCRERLELMRTNLEVEYKETFAATRDARKKAIHCMKENSAACDYKNSFPLDLSNALENIIASSSSKFCRNFEEIDWVESQVFILHNDLRSKFADLENECESLVSESCLSDKNSWDEYSHSVFVRFMKRRRAGVQKLSVIKILKFELPDKTEADILRHFDWWERRRIAKDKQKSAKDWFRRKKEEFVHNGLQSIETLRQSIAERRETKASRTVQSALRESLNKRLTILRELREKEEQIAAVQLEEKTSRVRASENAEKELELERRAAMKSAIAQYTDERNKRNEETRKLAEDSIQIARRQHNNGLRLRKQRINYRDNLLSAKARERELELIGESERERERIEKLDKLARSVPYYDRIKECKADIFKTTCSRKHDVYLQNTSELADFQMNKMRNFSNERLFSNIRFKLADAFFAGGVSNTSYARSVIKQLVPREPERTTGIEPF